MVELRRCELAPAALGEAGKSDSPRDSARPRDRRRLPRLGLPALPRGPGGRDQRLRGRTRSSATSRARRFARGSAGREERGLNLHHAVTDPARGGRGIFKGFVRAVLEAGASEGYGFVVGLPNANSTFGVVERLGFQLVRPLSVKLGVGATPERDDARAAGVRAALERGRARLATRPPRRALPGATPRRARQRVRAGRPPRRGRRAGHVPGRLDPQHAAGVARARPAAHVGRPRSGAALVAHGPISISRAAGCRLRSTSCSST